MVDKNSDQSIMDKSMRSVFGKYRTEVAIETSYDAPLNISQYGNRNVLHGQ